MSEAAVATVRVPSFDDLEVELASTRRILERVPDEHWSWRPHQKSMSLGELATHLAHLLFMADAVVRRDSFDLAEERTATAAGREELLRRFDAHAETLRATMAGASADRWGKPWQLTRGSQVVRALPRGAALRFVGINHLVHHRGQLSVYLRLLDVPVPGMYGPSADERGH